jgi:opacity protein-like surface antigen
MVWLRRLLCSAAALALLGAGARAADMPGYPPEPLPPPAHEEHPLIEQYGGWYLRGDLGYAWGEIQGADSAATYPDPTENSLDNGFVGGLGAGYKSKWLRTDVTLDYTSPLKYTGSILAPDDTTAKVEGVTALFNGYIDLGTWYHATPYIGAGAGASQLRVFDYSSTAAPPFTGGLSHTQWNFTWALTGGVAYAIAPNLMLDLNYRYVNFGDVTTASDAFGEMTLKNLYAHEVRIGIRWSFDDQAFFQD